MENPYSTYPLETLIAMAENDACESMVIYDDDVVQLVHKKEGVDMFANVISFNIKKED